MRNRTRTIVAVASSVLSMSIAVLWVRSYACCDTAIVSTEKWMRALSSNRGVIEYTFLANISHAPIAFTSFSANAYPAKPHRLGSVGPPPSWGEEWRDCLAFTDFGGGLVRVVRAPHALILLAFGVPTVIALSRMGLRRRPVECCAKCGYNLKGNMSGVCPECGTPTSSSVSA
jgi:hypothetical protein